VTEKNEEPIIGVNSGHITFDCLSYIKQYHYFGSTQKNEELIIAIAIAIPWHALVSPHTIA
jgi:hypothetical protein